MFIRILKEQNVGLCGQCIVMEEKEKDAIYLDGNCFYNSNSIVLLREVMHYSLQMKAYL